MIAGAPRYRAPILLGLTFVLLALTVFLSGPWHRHDLLSGKACPFTTVERGVMEQVSHAAPLVVPGLSGRASQAPDPVWRCMPGRSAIASRAPPPSLPLHIV